MGIGEKIKYSWLAGLYNFKENPGVTTSLEKVVTGLQMTKSRVKYFVGFSKFNAATVNGSTTVNDDMVGSRRAGLPPVLVAQCFSCSFESKMIASCWPLFLSFFFSVVGILVCGFLP